MESKIPHVTLEGLNYIVNLYLMNGSLTAFSSVIIIDVTKILRSLFFNKIIVLTCPFLGHQCN